MNKLPNHENTRSSFIEAIGYDDDAREMHVLFVNNTRTAYACPRTHYENLLKENQNPQGSVGRYFANNIAKTGDVKFPARIITAS